MEPYSHDLFYDNFVETTYHDGIQQTKAMLVNFPEKFPFREVTHTQIGPKLPTFCLMIFYLRIS